MAIVSEGVFVFIVSFEEISAYLSYVRFTTFCAR